MNKRYRWFTEGWNHKVGVAAYDTDNGGLLVAHLPRELGGPEPLLRRLDTGRLAEGYARLIRRALESGGRHE